MSQTLTLELSDSIFTAIRQRAEQMGIPPEHLVADLVEQNFFQASKTFSVPADQDIARLNFERHFGMLDFDGEISVTNESMDADLAKEYASTHEEE
ncbi:MAG: hypothetical protein NW224_20345 [Leptolyngbyaceae cyanobacterium bins.302]|nr:hypothetical protein [Leptolyngbyaceae cyanobacterium bins.302]